MIDLRAALSLCVVAVGACGGSTPPTAEPTAAPSASAAPAAQPSASASAAASPPVTPPTATVSGTTLTLAYGGKSYDLSHSVVLAGDGTPTVQFEQPMDVGYNQIWLSTQEKAKKGKPIKVHGFGMTGAFVQLADGTANVKNVSNDCSSDGTITFKDVPTVGRKASGSIDVTITCSHVAALPAPLVVKGDFDGIAVKKGD